MPIYEYRCNQCEREFERYVQTARVPVECPACQSAGVTRRLSVLGSLRVVGTAPAVGASGGGGGCCGGGCGCH